MPLAPKLTEEKIKRFINAWETLRPEKSFAASTLAEAKAKIQPSLDARTQITTLENQLLAAKNQREDADVQSLQFIATAVNAVKGDPTEGDDGELYEAMGFVRRSERKSGLTRAKKPAAAG